MCRRLHGIRLVQWDTNSIVCASHTAHTPHVSYITHKMIGHRFRVRPRVRWVVAAAVVAAQVRGSSPVCACMFGLRTLAESPSMLQWSLFQLCSVQTDSTSNLLEAQLTGVSMCSTSYAAIYPATSIMLALLAVGGLGAHCAPGSAMSGMAAHHVSHQP